MARESYRSFLLFLIVIALLPPVHAQSRRNPRARQKPATAAQRKPARAVTTATPFTLVTPSVPPGESAAARFPAGEPGGIAAHVFQGARQGPVIAFLFHGFSEEKLFHEAAEAVFGAIPRSSLQGTILVLSLPARRIREEQKPCAPEGDWLPHEEELLKAARFVVDLHLGVKGAAAGPYAFIYPPEGKADPRLVTYTKAMVRASLIPNVVELRESDLASAGLSAAALEHLAPRSMALNHPAISIEAAAITGETGAALRKGLQNLLDHLKMASGAVSWQGRVKEHTLESLPPDFFAPGP